MLTLARLFFCEFSDIDFNLGSSFLGSRRQRRLRRKLQYEPKELLI
jgi:hypothetical protein